MSAEISFSSLVEKFATEENPYHFTDSGLDNIYLIGIKYFVDGEGNPVSAEIPALKPLLQLIARDVVLSPLDLSGKEIRFLRKRLGKKATEFCTYLGFDPATLSRIENENQRISPQSQKLARLSYCFFSEDAELADCARTILQSIIEEIQEKKQRIVLKIDENQDWQELKAA